MFKDWNLVLAAYNWGEGKVLKLMDRSGINDFWELMELRRNFPKETQNHVPLIMASIILARNPDKYGLPSDLDSALEVSKIQVGKPIDLRAAARILNISLEELKQLNPALRGLSTPPGYPEFQLNIPANSTADMEQKIAKLPEIRLRPRTDLVTTRYKIQSGDTLDKLARRFGTSVAALKSENRITSPNQLKAGGWIRVPARSTSASSRIKSATLKPSTNSKTPIPKAPVAKKPAVKTPVKSGNLSPAKSPIPKAPAKSIKPAASIKKPAAKEIASR